VSTGDDLSANPAQSADGFAAATWDDWMRWTPSQAQATPKPLNAQGPLSHLNNPENARLYNTRLGADLQGPALTAPGPEDEVVAPSAIPFTFGQPVDTLPAFQFSAPVTSAAVTAGQQIPAPLATDWNSNNNLASPLSLDGQSQVPPLSTPSLGHSPESAQMQATSSSDHSSPEGVTKPVNKKKRKSLVDEDAAKETPSKQHPVKKTAHNMIEKRYRTNLNDKIAALRDSVPSLRVMSRTGNSDEDDDVEDLEGLTPAHKLNKATVLSKATEYIRHLEKRNKKLQEEVASLKARADAYDKMAMAGGPFAFQAGMLSAAAQQPRFDTNPFPQSPDPMAGHPHPQGMIPVPDAIARLRQSAVNQPHYANQGPFTTAPGQQIPGQTVMNGPQGRNGMVNKLMVGSLAGLMLMEGFASREQAGEGTEARGLFALPLQLMSSLDASLRTPLDFAPNGLLPILKLLLLVGAFLHLIAPLFHIKPRPKQKAPAVRLAPAPSLASPVEVRRKAWLTAIQTVWVPQHSFPLELAALLLKTLKLSTRQLIGWRGYSLITGFTREQEAARVKAWDIAVDAQLAGGDEEISTSRLLLTLLASGTLPDTPTRLMLKALHFRLMLWDLSKNGYRPWWLWMFNSFNLKMARSYWNAARDQNRLLKNSAPRFDDAEPLPAHLSALLELDCDNVLVDAIIQRAYNLAWNHPTAHDACIDETMDSVVEDFAISSPLDAVASWWSSLVLSRVLVRSLDADDSSRAGPALTPDLEADLEVAISTAPPASCSYVRALAAKAVFSGAEPDIAGAYAALPHTAPSSPAPASGPRTSRQAAALLNLIQASPAPATVIEALTLAKLQALEGSGTARGRAMAGAALRAYAPDEAAFSLLSFVAAYRVLCAFAPAPGVERVAVALRLCVGRDAARRMGLGAKARGRVAERCLAVSKVLVGVPDGRAEEDEGFVSDEGPVLRA